MGVYNEAGELVKWLLAGSTFEPINSLDLAPGNVISKLNGNGSWVDILSGGIFLGTWDGRRSDGNPVSNGVYHIKVNNIDSHGVVTTVTRQVVVSRSLAKVRVDIFNGAGERVRRLYSFVDDASGLQMTSLSLSAHAVAPGNSGGPVSLQMVIQNSGVPVTLTWDGRSDQGAVVTSGHYQIGVHWEDGQGRSQDITQGVLVTGHTASEGNITASPNILGPAGPLSTTFRISPNAGWTLRVRIYTMAGESVAVREGPPGAGQVSWDASGIASGLYLAAAEVLHPNGGVAQRHIVKVLVRR
jgi:flagellar hook assembly protein FlgD